MSSAHLAVVAAEAAADRSLPLPVQYVLILLVAMLAHWLVRFVLRRKLPLWLGDPTVRRRLELLLNSAAEPVEDTDAPVTSRRRQRLHTLTAVTLALCDIVIFATAVITMLTISGLKVTPLLTSAGLITVAVGFGAQQLLRDGLAGFGMLLEDQFGVGDRIQVVLAGGTVDGTVESVTLRTTHLRDDDGVVHHLRNGEIVRVANFSLGPVSMRLLFHVPASTDLRIYVSLAAEAERAAGSEVAVSIDGPMVAADDKIGVQLTATGAIEDLLSWRSEAVHTIIDVARSTRTPITIE